MRPNISEFSYGYAFTENFIQGIGLPLTAAPVFPTLFAEGQPGGGYDLALNFRGVPIFVQFKLAHFLTTSNAREYSLFGNPYYRMPLMSSRHSTQHQMLVDLETSGEIVYYAAPIFHQPQELNNTYLANRILQRSIFLEPNQIGALPDDQNHYVVYQDGGPCYFCSEPTLLIETFNEETFIKNLYEKISSNNTNFYQSIDIKKLHEELISIILKYRFQNKGWGNLSEDQLRSSRNPLSQAAYLARTFFGSELLLIQEK